MIRMSVNRILPFLLLLVLFTSCNRKYKIEGSSSVTSLDGKMLFSQDASGRTMGER